MRFVHASRTLPGPEDVEEITTSILEGLTKPLTQKEKQDGKMTPKQHRILFEGTLDEAEEFYQKAEWMGHPVNAPIAVYTDGSPIAYRPKSVSGKC